MRLDFLRNIDTKVKQFENFFNESAAVAHVGAEFCEGRVLLEGLHRGHQAKNRVVNIRRMDGNGISKRRYGLDRVLPYLEETSQTEATMAVFSMNFAYCLRALLPLFLRRQSLMRRFS